MTGRELIIYILTNNLENDEVIKDGKLVGFETDIDMAVRMGVGTETIRTLSKMGKIEGHSLGCSIYIPRSVYLMKDPLLDKEIKNV